MAKKRRPPSRAEQHDESDRRYVEAGLAGHTHDLEQVDLLLIRYGKELAMNFRRIGELQAEIDALRAEMAIVRRKING